MRKQTEIEQCQSEFSNEADNYTLDELVGQGSYGAVYEGTNKKTGERVAIKKVQGYNCSVRTLKHSLRELEILKQLDNENVIKAKEIIQGSGAGKPIYIIMELLPSDLHRLIHSPDWLEPIQVKKIMYEAMLGINYLHSAGIVHRDIKPANILVDEKCQAKICDFNLARGTHGLKSRDFDFDKVYRKEFSRPPSEFYVDSEPEDDDTIPDEVTNTLDSPNAVSLPGRFVVSIGKTHEKVSVQGAISSGKLTETLSRLPQRESSSPDIGTQRLTGRSAAVSLIRPLRVKDLDLRRKALMNSTQHLKVSKRELTTHITTRWYRAPEIVLLDRVYSCSVDIWGMGCVFGELLQTIKGNVESPQDRSPLFPGNSCFPLSPMPGYAESVPPMGSSCEDQLGKILSVIGTPSEEDVEFLTEKNCKIYVKGMKKYPKTDFAKMFPKAEPEAIDLLEKMLTFNPYLRITAKEALAHPYFKDVRRGYKEAETEHNLAEAEREIGRKTALLSFCYQDV